MVEVFSPFDGSPLDTLLRSFPNSSHLRLERQTTTTRTRILLCRLCVSRQRWQTDGAQVWIWCVGSFFVAISSTLMILVRISFGRQITYHITHSMNAAGVGHNGRFAVLVRLDGSWVGILQPRPVSFRLSTNPSHITIGRYLDNASKLGSRWNGWGR